MTLTGLSREIGPHAHRWEATRFSVGAHVLSRLHPGRTTLVHLITSFGVLRGEHCGLASGVGTLEDGARPAAAAAGVGPGVGAVWVRPEKLLILRRNATTLPTRPCMLRLYSKYNVCETQLQKKDSSRPTTRGAGGAPALASAPCPAPACPLGAPARRAGACRVAVGPSGRPHTPASPLPVPSIGVPRPQSPRQKVAPRLLIREAPFTSPV